jgi:hypothetical protein
VLEEDPGSPVAVQHVLSPHIGLERGLRCLAFEFCQHPTVSFEVNLVEHSLHIMGFVTEDEKRCFHQRTSLALFRVHGGGSSGGYLLGASVSPCADIVIAQLVH